MLLSLLLRRWPFPPVALFSAARLAVIGTSLFEIELSFAAAATTIVFEITSKQLERQFGFRAIGIVQFGDCIIGAHRLECLPPMLCATVRVSWPT